MDLCSITQTCTRLNAIGHRLFTAKHKICDFDKTSAKTPAEATKFFLIFGSLIKELDICLHSNSNPIDVMDAVIRYCTTLESLTLEGYEIPDNQGKIADMRKLFQNLRKLRIEQVTFGYHVYEWTTDVLFTPNGNLIGSFSNCKCLVNLEVLHCKYLNRVIFESSFPKLECFKYSGNDGIANCHLDGFTFRHPNLKSFCMVNVDCVDDDHLAALKMVAANCKNLEKLVFDFETYTRSAEYEKILKNLPKLSKLREIKICWMGDFATMFVQELPNFRHTLEALSLAHGDGGSGLIAAVIQLKKLRFLQLASSSSVLEDIDPLGELTRLTSLSISQNEANLKFDLVKLVDRLVNLNKLQFHVCNYKIGNQTYLQLVHAVERRPDLRNRTLRIDCRTSVDLQLAAVKFEKLDEFE